MASSELLIDAFGRIRETVHAVTCDLTAEELSLRLDPDANSIAWLVWHLTRIQDDHLAAAAEIEQVWVARGWREKFDLPFSARDTGYGHSGADVTTVQVGSPQLLTGYYDAVHEQTIRYVRGLGDFDLSRIVDERWDPPVTLGVRLISVVSDDLQHAGQAAFIRGSIRRR